MAKIYMERICYRHGVVKPENKVIELHGFCECSTCKWRQQYINHGLRNVITVTIKNEDRLSEAKEFIGSWKCGKQDYTFKREYITF